MLWIALNHFDHIMRACWLGNRREHSAYMKIVITESTMALTA